LGIDLNWGSKKKSGKEQRKKNEVKKIKETTEIEIKRDF
jgi:hypothetical protein